MVEQLPWTKVHVIGRKLTAVNWDDQIQLALANFGLIARTLIQRIIYRRNVSKYDTSNAPKIERGIVIVTSTVSISVFFFMIANLMAVGFGNDSPYAVIINPDVLWTAWLRMMESKASFEFHTRGMPST